MFIPHSKYPISKNRRDEWHKMRSKLFKYSERRLVSAGLAFFNNHPEILAVMSERGDGSMKLFRDSNLNLENRKIFFNRIGADSNKIIAAEIVHSSRAEIVDNVSPKFILGADALVTKDKNIALSITVADCFPVFFNETKNQTIALAHCGWRGILGGIIKNTFNRISELGGETDNLMVAIGPGIQVCHFEIGENILDEFQEYGEATDKKDGKLFVDLRGIIKKQLTKLGVNEENIKENTDCTFENNRKYFSFRRDKSKAVEAMVAVLGFRSLSRTNCE